MAVTKDTIMRCQYCGGVAMHKHLATGGCPHCGGKRFNVAFKVNDEEKAWLEGQGYTFTPEQWSNKPAISDAA